MCCYQKEKDKLTGALIGLARVTDGNEHLISEASTAVIVEGLYATHPGVHTDKVMLEGLLERVKEEKRKMVPDCFSCASSCGKNDDYNMDNLQNEEAEIRSLKNELLCGIRDIASYVYAAAVPVHCDKEIFYKALTAIGIGYWERDDLLSIVQEMHDVRIQCKNLLGNGGSA